MKCISCNLEGDKYVLFNCDNCEVTQCKTCGDYTASEEKCFPLSKRRVILYCKNCKESEYGNGRITEIIQKNKNLRQKVENLKMAITLRKDEVETQARKQEEEIEKSTNENQKMKEHILSLEEQIRKLEKELQRKNDLNEQNIQSKLQVKKLELELKEKHSENSTMSIQIKNLIRENDKLKSDNNKILISSTNENNLSTVQQLTTQNIDYNKYTLPATNTLSELENKFDAKLQSLTLNFDKKISELRNQIVQPRQAKKYSEVAGTAKLDTVGTQRNNTSNNLLNKTLYETTLEKEQRQLMENIINLSEVDTNRNIGITNVNERSRGSIKKSLENEWERTKNKSENINNGPSQINNRTSETKNPNQRAINAGLRNKIIRGTGQEKNMIIKGIKQLSHTHICKLDPNLKEQDIIQHVKANGINDVQCIKLDSRKPDEYSSFRISVPKNDTEKLRNADIWPEGVIVSPFLFRLYQHKNQN
ncbi:hypothetical protein WA026_012870 [Henosepilachna vigintioctopunctata]|uniref:B box-type domain-containing protein n=1 Tax=Henosepilachna vigintioctopunctata TaxID=420089 RepID=A0AAW1TWG0_9CUCU